MITISYTGGDCQTTNIPVDSEMMVEPADYKYMQESHEDNNNNNNNNRLLIDILANNSGTYLPQNNLLSSTLQTLRFYKLDTFKSNYRFHNRSVLTKPVQNETYARLDVKEHYKSTLNNLDSKVLHDNTSGKTPNHVEQLKRYHNLLNLARSNNSVKHGKLTYSNQWKHNARGLDTYAESLLYVNKIYNVAYGLERRRVPAHMPHLVDKWIVNNMQQKFEHEFRKTSSHKVRDPEDMQFAFSYFYFLSSEKRKVPVDEIFDMFDTDKSR